MSETFPGVSPWPKRRERADESEAPAPVGHNQPPVEERIPAEFREALLTERADFMVLLDNLLGVGDPNSEDYKPGAVQRAKCTDAETLGKCGELVKKLRAADQLVTRIHTEVKAPYLLASQLCDAEKRAFAGRISAGKVAVEDLQNTYLRGEQQKAREAELERQAEIAKQNAERRRLEELARENNIDPAVIPVAAPPPPPPVRAEPVRSDGGATVSAQKEWKSEVEDWLKAFKHVKTDANVRDAIAKAIQREVKATKGAKAIPGVRIYEDVKASNR